MSPIAYAYVVYTKSMFSPPYDDGVDLLENGRRVNEILNLTSN